MSPYIWTIDLAAGKGREVFRDEIDPDAIDICRGTLRALRAGRRSVAIPHDSIPGLAVALRYDGTRCLSLAVRDAQSMIMAVGIAGHERCGAAVWRDMLDWFSAVDRPQPRAPWCAYAMADTAASSVSALLILHALPACLAWAHLAPESEQPQ